MTPAIRISLGVVSLTTSLLFVADWALDIFPDPYAPELEARMELAESLAIRYSSAFANDRTLDMKPVMESFVGQRPEVLSMNLENAAGESLAITRDHVALWEETEQSTPDQILVPIFRGEEQWAVLQVKFDELPHTGIIGLFSTSLYKLVAAMAGLGFLTYTLFLSRTLRYLDPSTVVPSRVRAALDQLLEGVVILDHDLRIVLVNTSFANQIGQMPDDLIGADPSSFPWVEQFTDSEMPWAAASSLGIRLRDIRLELQSPTLGRRILKVNVSPIADGAGKQQGVLVSFNDISDIERANESLRSTLNDLEAAHEEVRQKNKELFQLATIDPLTECLNRRAFYEKLEHEFEKAKRENLMLSVVMADIDHFKRVNDDFGHATGDIVIKEMAKTLNDSLGANDCVGRYGGEEFCMLLVGANESDAIDLSNRARLEFASLFETADSATKGRLITASFGVSMISFGSASGADFVNQADLALYQSKNDGRNRVSSWKNIDANLQQAS